MLRFIDKIIIAKESFYNFIDDDENKVQLSADELRERLRNGDNIPEFQLDKLGKISHCAQNLDGKQFGHWKVLYRINGKTLRCLCELCNKEYDVLATNLITGNTQECRECSLHEQKNNLEGMKINHWTVIKHIGKSRYLCQCDCENQTERIIQASTLLNGTTKSCGCVSSGFKDITNKMFGNWKVLSYEGKGYWKCQCQCENKTEQILYGGSLRAGRTKSCGCLKQNNRANTLIDKYGEVSTHFVNNPREQWQIDAIQSKESLLAVINEHDTITSLSSRLNLSYSAMSKIIHEFGLENNINIHEAESEYEKQLLKYIKGISNYEVMTRCRKVIPPYELDIYIPEKQLAIEFNGDYWHSTLQKSKNYHQDKTIACAKQGIHLIHIFEHEWIKNSEKIKQFISNILNNNKIRIMARNTVIKEVNTQDEKQFLEENHLQGYSASSICIGSYYNNELISLLSFRKPRFNNNYEYEIIRYCNKNNYIIIGGLEKMFSYFLKQYNPTSIITYSDISKFTGNCYTKIGFKPIQPNPITEPNYVWVSADKNTVLSRYQTQKQRLIDEGLGTEDQTEDNIMSMLNFLKVYDSGNIRLEWIKE